MSAILSSVETVGFYVTPTMNYRTTIISTRDLHMLIDSPLKMDQCESKVERAHLSTRANHVQLETVNQAPLFDEPRLGSYCAMLRLPLLQNLMVAAFCLNQLTHMRVLVGLQGASLTRGSGSWRHRTGCGSITAIVISVLVTALLAVLLTRSIVHPLQKLLVINESIARGNLSHPIIADGKDEFTLLMISSQHMQSSLKETISLIGLSSRQLALAADELNAVRDESSRGLARQNNEIDQAATAVNEMTAAVDEVARNSSAASDAAKQSDKPLTTRALPLHRLATNLI